MNKTFEQMNTPTKWNGECHKLCGNHKSGKKEFTWRRIDKMGSLYYTQVCPGCGMTPRYSNCLYEKKIGGNAGRCCGIVGTEHQCGRSILCDTPNHEACEIDTRGYLICGECVILRRQLYDEYLNLPD